MATLIQNLPFQATAPAVSINGNRLTVEFIVPGDQPDSRATVLAAMKAAIVGALEGDADMARFKKLSAGASRVKADQEQTRKALVDAKRDQQTATDSADVDGMLAAKDRAAAAEARAAAAADAADMLLRPLADLQSRIRQKCDSASAATLREQGAAAEGKVEKERAALEKFIGQRLANLAQATAESSHFVSERIATGGTLRSDAITAAMAELTKAAPDSASR